MKKITVFISFFISLNCFAQQINFSFATDLSLMRNFSPQQKFFAIGQTVQVNFHFSPKQSAYAWLDYYTPGKFTNNFLASAKSSSTFPSAINYSVTGRIRYRQISLGWKHYFKGAYNNDNDWNLYGIAGFGLLFGLEQNTFSQLVDTSQYKLNAPFVQENNVYEPFKRLTMDFGAGVDYPLGGNFFVYGDVKTWIPTTSESSLYLQNTKNVPLPVMVSVGLRILMGFNY